MFTKMQKYYISVFAIVATVLVFADANGFVESTVAQRTAEAAAATVSTTTARSTVALVGAKVAASEEAVQAHFKANGAETQRAGNESAGVETKTAQLEKNASALNQGLTDTTTVTTKATTTTTTKTTPTTQPSTEEVAARSVTLASPNAPTTLTTTNDVDERVLNTATASAAALAVAAETAINDEQAKPRHQAHADGVEGVGSSLIKTDVGERPITPTKTPSTTKINAAVQMVSGVIPTAPTHAGRSLRAGKTTEAPTVNFESKSRADAKPLKTGNGAMAPGATQQEADSGNVAKTEIIKNAKELRTKRLNEQADAHIDEHERGGSQMRLQAPKTDTETVEAHSEFESEQKEKRRVLSNGRHLEVEGSGQREREGQRVVEKHSDITQASKKPQTEETQTWPKEVWETTNKLTPKEAETETRLEPTETVTLHARFSENGATNVNLPMSDATIAETGNEKRNTAATTTTKASPSSDINIMWNPKNGPYRIKLAEIVTDEYNGSGSGEKSEVLGAQQIAANSETRLRTTTADSVLETSSMNRKEEGVMASTLQKQQQAGIQQEVGQQAQKTIGTKLQKQQHEQKKQQQTKLVKQRAQQASGEQELAQQNQPKPANQLRREQQQQRQQVSNKDMDNGQVEQQKQQQRKQKAYTASELNNKNQKSNNNNNNNNQQPDDHDAYAKPANTNQVSAQPTPPALNIVDLYPMKMEDFNPIIRDSNAKLLKERTIYKPTGNDEAAKQQEQRLEQAESHYGRVDSTIGDGLMKSSVGHQENLLPNEVNTADNIIRRQYDNINNLAAAQQHSVNRRPIMQVAEKGASGAESTNNSHQQQEPEKLWDAVSDFTGKLLAERDGVITEIEQKFRLNEFTVTDEPTTTTTAAATTTIAAKASKVVATPQPSAVPKSSYSVNHKIQPSKSLKPKYSNKESVTPLSPMQKHDFIERRVKKSFDFPMHRTASASDMLGMPHVDFANTKFNTGGGATQSLSPTTLGDSDGALGVRTALGAHPEFSTTKFYNSKELYNEMMLHNRQRLKAKAKMEQATATATAARAQAITGVETITAATNMARNGVASAASRFALSQSSKLETTKYAPTKAAARQAIMGEVNMNSQQTARVNSEGAASSAVEVSLANPGVAEAHSQLTAKSIAKGGINKYAEAKHQKSTNLRSAEQHSNRHTNVQLATQPTTAATTATNNQMPAVETTSSTVTLDSKTTKKYHKELQRAKLLLKSLLLPTTNDNIGAGANKSSDAMATTSITTKTTTTLQPNSSSQTNLHAPPTVRSVHDTPAPTPGRVDLVATAKTFDIMSLAASKSSQVVTPTIATSSAVGNIDSSTIDSDMSAAGRHTEGVQVELGNSVSAAVKHAKPTQTTATTSKPAKTTRSAETTTTTSTKNPPPSTSTVIPTVDTTTNIPLIYPYPQMPGQVTMLITQPHDTTATASSVGSSLLVLGDSALVSSSYISDNPTTRSTNLSPSIASKPIVRPRILSPLQEKINSLECELQNVPSDSHLWRGNETHELLLPIVSTENCPYGSIDCTPLLVSWDGEAEIQSGDILIVEINDTLLSTSEHNVTHTSLAYNTQVYQVTRSGHEHCDVTEGILLDITPLVVDGRKLVTLYDKDLTEGVNLLIVVSELWGTQCVRLKVTAKTDNCGENAECSGKGVCYSNAAMEEYECQCCSGFAGPHCEEIDACTPSPCTNNGICVDLSQGHEGNSYQCLCPYGYTGKNCQYESDPCNSAECMNGGTCMGNSTHFRCDCTPGYTGPLCQHSLNECESSPCVHGICVDQEDGFRCFCQPGFAGELCNFEYNECESNPCQNDGECIDHIGNFECRCTKGYTGARCQIKVDFCANKPCPDGHHCIDHGNDFTCECPRGRNGLDCNQMPPKQCTENLCKHGGTCWTSGASFYCACRPGYTGNMCEDEFVVETVVSSSEFMVDDTSARNFNDKTFGSSVVLKSPIELHNAYFGAGVLASAVFIVAIVVTICHCKVNHTYRKFSTRSSTFFPILGFGRRSKSQNKLNKHWLSGKGLSGAGGGAGGGLLRSSSGSTTSLTRGHLPSAHNAASLHQSQHQQRQQRRLQRQQMGGQMHERPFQRHLAMNLENDMYYTVDFSENSQHSPLIQ